jgi:hypothetical protein
MNHVLHPTATEEQVEVAMRQQRDECPTLSRYLMWKEGNSGNLQQFVDDVFPSYYEWMHNHVLSHEVAFKGPPPSESVETSTLTPRQLKVLHSTVERIALSGMDDQTLPGSRFSGQRSPYESMVHHAMTMSEILREWVIKALDTLVTGTYFYFYPGWTQETLEAYLLAYVSDFDQTMRDFIISRHSRRRKWTRCGSWTTRRFCCAVRSQQLTGGHARQLLRSRLWNSRTTEPLDLMFR